MSGNKFDQYKYDDASNQIWSENYKAGYEKTREDTWKRAAKACAATESEELKPKIEKEFLSMMYNDKFIPGGRILANLGVEDKVNVTLYNCFVHNPRDINLKDCDSIDGIYDLLKAQAKTLRSEGGYGINASFIRPAGAYINGIGSRTPGVLKFMELWDKSSEILTLGSVKLLGGKKSGEKNKIRKGAQMLVLDIWHPDIEDFITCKQTKGRLTKFNMSVGITEGFMTTLLEDGMWDLKFPNTEHEKYKTEWFGDIKEWEDKGYPVVVHKQIKAQEIWNLIMESTYNRNEPGVLFLDIANKMNPVYWFDLIKTTNPCGEVPMSTGVCNLGSINLVSFVENVNDSLSFDFKSFSNTVTTAIRFLDNVNDISSTPLPEYKQSVLEKRRIGLGVMGLGSLHLMLGIRYGSEDSIKLVEQIFKIKSETELLASALLGKEKGSFSKFDREKYFSSYWWTNLRISSDIKKQIEEIGCMRNSHQSMNAPTGNTGIYARNVSGGIEPVFDVNGYFRWSIVNEFDRRDLVGVGFKFPDVGKNEWFETEHVKFNKRGDETILKGTFNNTNYEIDTNRGLTKESFVVDYGIKFAKEFYKDKFEDMKKSGVLASAQELSTTEHLDVLKCASHYTNMAISKTVNVPEKYPYEDFKNLYLEAWKSNLKGITTYREGTMTAVLETKSNNDKVNVKEKKLVENHAPKRPKELECDIHVMTVRGEKWTFFVGKMENRPYEVIGGQSKYISIPKRVKFGKIVKHNGTDNPVARYDLHYDYEKGPDEEATVKDLVNIFENATEAAFTRTVSLALRHGVPIQYVVEQITKGSEKDDDLFSFSKALSRVLKTYIVDGTKTNKTCDVCKSDQVSYQEGCMLCTSCFYSKCS